MLMLGNVLRECGVTQRLLQAAQNEIINVVTIFSESCGDNDERGILPSIGNTQDHCS